MKRVKRRFTVQRFKVQGSALPLIVNATNLIESEILVWENSC
ncbi:hypothetical protein D1AOALGA4SA_3626 [Olavius algarvensis Delta 1 endosymbiont]|nr:hypothetical protein D1AOALGA4SA_3626 [Olavius algarvensis Delta 1 endosymbiont]